MFGYFVIWGTLADLRNEGVIELAPDKFGKLLGIEGEVEEKTGRPRRGLQLEHDLHKIFTGGGVQPIEFRG